MEKHLSKGFLGDQSGQTLIEYIAIGVIIIVFLVAMIRALGSFLETKETEIESSFGGG